MPQGQETDDWIRLQSFRPTLVGHWRGFQMYLVGHVPRYPLDALNVRLPPRTSFDFGQYIIP